MRATVADKAKPSLIVPKPNFQFSNPQPPTTPGPEPEPEPHLRPPSFLCPFLNQKERKNSNSERLHSSQRSALFEPEPGSRCGVLGQLNSAFEEPYLANSNTSQCFHATTASPRPLSRCPFRAPTHCRSPAHAFLPSWCPPLLRCCGYFHSDLGSLRRLSLSPYSLDLRLFPLLSKANTR